MRTRESKRPRGDQRRVFRLTLTQRRRVGLVALGIVLGLLPVLVPLVRGGCVPGCSPAAIPGVGNPGDISNIADRSWAIARGASPYSWRDPILRYPALSLLMLLTVPLGVSPVTVTMWFAIVVEFVALPLAFYLLGQKAVGDADAAALGVVALGVSTHLLMPWRAATMWAIGDWYNAWAMVPFLLALRATLKPRNVRWAGIWLAVTALNELVFAAVAAATVGLSLMIEQEWRGLVEAAGTSMILSLPLVPSIVLYTGKWSAEGSSRAGLNNSLGTGLDTVGLQVGATVVVLATVAAIVAAIVAPAVRDILKDVPTVLVVGTALTWALTWVFLFGFRGFWIKQIAGWMFEFVALVLLVAVVDAALSRTELLADDVRRVRERLRSGLL